MSVITPHESTLKSLNMQPEWHRKAPQELIASCPLDDLVASWQVWQSYLRTRKNAQLPRSFMRKKSPLVWGWPNEWDRASIKKAIHTPAALAENVLIDDAS